MDKSGSWLQFGATRLGQGREKARDLLLENRDILREIEAKVRTSFAPTVAKIEKVEETAGPAASAPRPLAAVRPAAPPPRAAGKTQG